MVGECVVLFGEHNNRYTIAFSEPSSSDTFIKRDRDSGGVWDGEDKLTCPCVVGLNVKQYGVRCAKIVYMKSNGK